MILVGEGDRIFLATGGSELSLSSSVEVISQTIAQPLPIRYPSAANQLGQAWEHCPYHPLLIS